REVGRRLPYGIERRRDEDRNRHGRHQLSVDGGRWLDRRGIIEPMLYVDHAATTPMRPEVLEAMQPFGADLFGNPSGVHGISRRAKDALEEARERVAAVLQCEPLEVVFTGGGTEADNLAIKGAALASGHRGGVVTVATEHEAVLESVEFVSRMGCPVAVLGVDRWGLVDPEAVAAEMTDETRLVSVMWANNETGVIQPVAEVADAVRRVSDSVLIHTDAVQAVISQEVAFDRFDLLTVAGHKLGGPRGSGALIVRNGVPLEPVVHGGGQELGRRSGTHNVAGAVGLAAALEAAVADRERFRRGVGEARRRFEERLTNKRPDVVI